jgi:hypothetical protein
VAVAGFSLRRQEAGVRGRVGLSHLHEAPSRQSAEGEEGLRQGPKKP